MCMLPTSSHVIKVCVCTRENTLISLSWFAKRGECFKESSHLQIGRSLGIGIGVFRHVCPCDHVCMIVPIHAPLPGLNMICPCKC